MLPILTVPNPILRHKSKPVTHIDKKVLDFIDQLQETLVKQDHPKGVGLSAVQIGKLWRIFATFIPPQPTLKIYLNPEIVTTSKQLTLGPDKDKPILEGCLSIPKLYGPVYRHKWVKLAWQTPKGNSQTAKFQDDFQARVIEHELDHLNGILFTDRAIKDNLPLYQEESDQLQPITLA